METDNGITTRATSQFHNVVASGCCREHDHHFVDGVRKSRVRRMSLDAFRLPFGPSEPPHGQRVGEGVGESTVACREFDKDVCCEEDNVGP